MKYVIDRENREGKWVEANPRVGLGQKINTFIFLMLAYSKQKSVIRTNEANNLMLINM